MEFLNRIDEIIIFRHLSKENVKKITLQRLNDLKKRILHEQKINIEFTDDTISLLADKGYDERFGIRELNRVIERMLGRTFK